MDGRIRNKSRAVPISASSTEAVISRTKTGKKSHVEGTTVPTDTTAGYAIGCIFRHLDGGSADALYINEGSETSCDFNRVPSIATANTFVGAQTISTSLAVTTADTLTVGGVIVPQELEVSFHAQAASAMVDQTFFVATQAYQVTKVRFVHAVAETTAATLAVQVTKDTSTNAPGTGTDLLTNNTNTGFDAKATANTVQTGTLTGTAASLQLAAGDRLSVDFSAAATELVGVTITVTLKRI